MRRGWAGGRFAASGLGFLVCVSCVSGCPTGDQGQVGSHVCLGCHDGRSASDQSQFPDGIHFFLECERCHGPGYLHVRNGGRGGDFIRNLGSAPFEQAFEICEECHPFQAAGYLESGHFESGAVRCAGCHDVHGTTETRRSFLDNNLCLNCHVRRGFDDEEAIAAHTRHPVDPAGTGASRCTACHMPPPERTHQADGPHYHSLVAIPPIASNEADDDGVFPIPPNSCSGTMGCHDGTVITAPVFDVDSREDNEVLQILFDGWFGDA